MCADHMFHMDVRPQRISALRLNDTTQRVTDRQTDIKVKRVLSGADPKVCVEQQ